MHTQITLENLIKGLRRANATYLYDTTLTLILDSAQVVWDLDLNMDNKEVAVRIYKTLLLEYIKSKGLLVERIIEER
jgi:hypothetical protein